MLLLRFPPWEKERLRLPSKIQCDCVTPPASPSVHRGFQLQDPAGPPPITMMPLSSQSFGIMPGMENS
jgi:hypothetical protein